MLTVQLWRSAPLLLLVAALPALPQELRTQETINVERILIDARVTEATALASWIVALPTPPAPAWTSTHSPACRRARRCSAKCPVW
jgi:hypothetical protein